jgi:DNA-binding Xre family transcriptional regulator
MNTRLAAMTDCGAGSALGEDTMSMLMAASPQREVPFGGGDMPTFRVRTEVLQQRRTARRESIETVVRNARVSRNAWTHLMRAQAAETVNLRTLASICQALGITNVSEILEFIPDDPAN